MSKKQQLAAIQQMITDVARPLYTEIAALKIALAAITQKQALDPAEVAQMVEFARNSEALKESVDRELAKVSEVWQLFKEGSEPTIH
jgi:peptidoglycan hydrolase CwlO-like protein